MNPKPYLKNLPLKVLVLIILFLIAAIAFGIIVHEVLGEKEDDFDRAVFTFLAHHTNPHRTGFMEVVSFFASDYFLWPAYVVLAIWYVFVRKKRRVALNTIAIGLTGALLVFSLKKYFHRPRPLGPLNGPALTYSFPSGHASLGFIFYGLLIYLAWKSTLPKLYKYIVSVLLFLLAILIGLSRVYLRKHYATDVLAGFCIGFAWLTTALFVLNKMDKSAPK
jgi:undecaprenyl-diphosphatase